MDDKHWTIMKHFDYNVFKYIPEEALRDGVLNPFDFTNISVDMESKDFDEYLELTQEINTIIQIGGSFTTIMRTGSGLKYKMLSKMNERKMLVSNYPAKFDVLKQIIDKHRKDKIIVYITKFIMYTNCSK